MKIRLPPEPPKQVFALATPADMLNKLYWEISQLEMALKPDEHYRISGTATYNAFNCAITSWHISDWVWETFGAVEREHLIRRFGATFNVKRKDALEKFQKLLRDQHRTLLVCWQIATGSKHKNMRQPDPLIEVAEVWINQSQAGLMRAGQPLGWHRQHLMVRDGEEKIEAQKLFKHSADIWDREFRSWGLLGDRFVDAD
jgi:hypothetical protein